MKDIRGTLALTFRYLHFNLPKEMEYSPAFPVAELSCYGYRLDTGKICKILTGVLMMVTMVIAKTSHSAGNNDTLESWLTPLAAATCSHDVPRARVPLDRWCISSLGFGNVKAWMLASFDTQSWHEKRRTRWVEWFWKLEVAVLFFGVLCSVKQLLLVLVELP